MDNPQPRRWHYLGRDRPGVGCRVIGIDGSENYRGRHGIIVGYHHISKAMVWVRWDDEPDGDHDEAVVISLLQDEPVLDQMSRIDP